MGKKLVSWNVNGLRACVSKGCFQEFIEKEDPDVTLSAEEREIGGLGIYMTKEFMDDVTYEYRDGQNILTLRKKL